MCTIPVRRNDEGTVEDRSTEDRQEGMRTAAIRLVSMAVFQVAAPERTVRKQVLALGCTGRIVLAAAGEKDGHLRIERSRTERPSTGR